MVIFGTGYVLGSRAGRERYAQLVKLAQLASQRLESRVASDPAPAEGIDGNGSDSRAAWRETPV